MHRIFINEFGRLRSGWRVLLFVFAFLAILLLLMTALRIGYAIVQSIPGLPRSNFGPELIYRGSLLASALGAGYLCARIFEGLPWRSLGLTLHAGWLKDLIVGSVIGFASLALAVVISKAGGGFNFSVNDAEWTSIARSMIGSAGLLIAAALAEEAIFRGYPLQTLSRAKLAWLGVLLTSVTFSLGHLSNPNVVPIFTFTNTVLAGVWLAAAYLKTRSLWLPLGVHWAWNWALGWFFGVPISGLKLVSNPLLLAQDAGPSWLTGGSYGIEGGLACTIALVLSIVFLWRMPWLSPTPELKKLTSEENPPTPLTVVGIRPADEHA